MMCLRDGEQKLRDCLNLDALDLAELIELLREVANEIELRMMQEAE